MAEIPIITEIEKAQLLDALRVSAASDMRVTKEAIDLCRRLCTAHDVLKKDQSARRNGVALIASYSGEKSPPDLCCVRIARNILSIVVERDALRSELKGVMVSVDKWFDDNDPRLGDNPATRAANAREIALRWGEAVEKERDELLGGKILVGRPDDSDWPFDNDPDSIGPDTRIGWSRMPHVNGDVDSAKAGS